jgi:hypothetical protein
LQLSPKSYLLNANARIAGALASMGTLNEAASEPVQPYADPLAIALDQQAGDIIAQLQIAIDQIRRAQTAVEARQAIARCEAAEAANFYAVAAE